MNRFLKITMALCAIFCGSYVNAQLTANAGHDTTVCAGSQVLLGGAPTARGGTGPYRYLWIPATGLSCDTCANPVFSANSAGNYLLTVIDAGNDTASMAIGIGVNQSPLINLFSSDSIVCSGQQVYLQCATTQFGCGLITNCTGTSAFSQVGTGNVIQPGALTQYPGLFGNWQHSCRNQMLYTAAELRQVLGGAVTISYLAFDIGEFNTSDYLENFALRIGCFSNDSLVYWDENMLTVYYSNLMQPVSGWNNFQLDSSFYWDGVSNLVVEVCYFDPVTIGNLNNKATCTNTLQSSYIYSAGNNNQCDTVTVPVVSNIRPNIKFGHCAVAAPALSYLWQDGGGVGNVLTPTNANTYVIPSSSGTYYLNVTNNNGCTNRDSINVYVRSASITTSTPVINQSCPGAASGTFKTVIFASDTIHYQLLNSNYSSTLSSGVAENGDTISFASLSAGTYHLLLSDSVCTNLDEPVTISQRLLFADTTISNPTCPVLVNGAIHAQLYGDEDSIHYKLLNLNSGAVLDSGNLADSAVIGFTNLAQGLYPLIISDSFCTVVYDFALQAPPQPNYTGNSFNPACFKYATAVGCVNIEGGTSPYIFTWSDTTIMGGCPQNVSAGNYALTVSDANNCSTVVSNITVGIDTFSLRVLSNQPAYGADVVAVSLSGTNPPYYISWGDGGAETVQQNDSHTYHLAGANYLSVTDANGCTIIDTIYSSFLLGIAQTDMSAIKIFPNPANGQLFVESPQQAISEIEILDVTGNVIQHLHLSGVHQSTFDISSCSSGVYLVIARVGELEYRERFVKY